MIKRTFVKTLMRLGIIKQQSSMMLLLDCKNLMPVTEVNDDFIVKYSIVAIPEQTMESLIEELSKQENNTELENLISDYLTKNIARDSSFLNIENEKVRYKIYSDNVFNDCLEILNGLLKVGKIKETETLKEKLVKFANEAASYCNNDNIEKINPYDDKHFPFL